MPTLKDVMRIAEKSGVDLDKISISKAVYRDIIEAMKDISFSELLKKKDN